MIRLSKQRAHFGMSAFPDAIGLSFNHPLWVQASRLRPNPAVPAKQIFDVVWPHVASHASEMAGILNQPRLGISIITDSFALFGLGIIKPNGFPN